MTTPSQAHDLIRAHFRDRWSALVSGWNHATQTAWQNKQFDPPSGEWVEFWFDFSGAERAEIGNSLWRHTAVAALTVYVPKATGRDRFDALIQAGLDAFQELQPDDLRILQTSVGASGIDERGRFRADIIIDVQFDQRY